MTITRNRSSKFRPCHILEPLEIRSLLSAAIQLSGNTHTIAPGDKTPSPDDYTDFRVMSTTVNAAIGTVSRTFTITNTGDADLTLTGAPVTLSGPAAADFIVAAQPATLINPGSTSTFTINFIPLKTGALNATVTLHTNDPAHASFTFAIKGTGLATINNSSNNLQYAVTHAGAGAPAITQNGTVSGTTVVFNYTGFLLDGTVAGSNVFESADVRGGEALPFVLGSGLVIDGFNMASVGIKVGESRAMFLPASLAYGDVGAPSVPPGATVIFTVTRVKAPAIAVAVNIHHIAFKESIPDPVDGTFMGTIDAGATISQLTTTFTISQPDGASAGAFTLHGNHIRLTGPQAADFSSSLIATATDGTATFTITYHPAKARNSTAIVHIASNDGAHPDFYFSIGANETPVNDLGVTLGAVNFPAGNITAGAPAKYKFPITVTNHGNIPVPANSPPLDVQIYLHDTTADTLTLITNASFSSTAFRNLAVGASRTLNVLLPIPVTVPAGTYDIIVKVDNSNLLNELTLANNSANSSQLVTVI